LIKRIWTIPVLFVLTSFALFHCATDPGSTAPIAGGAICTYDGCEMRVVVNVVRTRASAVIYALGHLYEEADPVDGLEDALTPNFGSGFTFTIAGCTTAPTLLSSQTSSTSSYLLASYRFPEDCDLADVNATLAVVISKPGYPNRTLNAAGGSSETGGGGGAALTHQTLFVTSTHYTGSIGSLGAADTHCINVVSTGSVTASLGGTWKAVMSDSGTSALSRITLHAGIPIKNTFGETLKSNAANLWDGSALLNGVTYDEDAELAGAPSSVWTGTSDSGVYSGSACTDWTDGTFGTNGTSGDLSVGNLWISAMQANCNSSDHIYCINM
jgi:hypothetical protein